MSTFPRNIKLKQSPNHAAVLGVSSTGNPAEPLLTITTRPTSDSYFRNIEFDAGLNSSAAWTEHINVGHAHGGKELEGDSLSISEEEREVDAVSPRHNTVVGYKQPSRQSSAGNGAVNEAEVEEDDQEQESTYGPGRPARVLYDFAGERALKELCLRAGEEIEVLQETIDGAEGWSLARVLLHGADGTSTRKQGHEEGQIGSAEEEREVGLVPREFYAFTTDFLSSPTSNAESSILVSHSKTRGEDPNGNATPRASTSASSTTATPKGPPLIPQNTGEWFRQQMRSVLGGRSLNRFSRFVTSGAEAYILRGAPPNGRPPPFPSSSSGSAPFTPASNSGQVSEDTKAEGLPPIQDQNPRLSAYLSPSSTRYVHTREPTALPPEISPDTHYIDVGDAGPTWRAKVPPFDVRVHSPEKRYALGGSVNEEVSGARGGEAGAYVVYSVTSMFDPPPPESGSDSDDSSFSSPNHGHAHTITVHRRFSHFVLLHTSLSSLLPGIALPPLPEKQYSGRLNADFVEARRGGLQRYLRMLIRHPVVRYSEPLRFFLGCEDEVEWRRQLTTYLPHSRSRPSSSTIQTGRHFYSSVYHPPFQIDLPDPSSADSTDLSDRFENHLQSVSQGVEHFRQMFGKIRQARVEMSFAERALGYEILGLITSRVSENGFGNDEDGGEEDESEGDEEWDGEGRGREKGNKVASPTSVNRRSGGGYKKQRRKGLQNAEGAWCWREECPDCLRLTKCLQKTAETLQGVADLYDNHARRAMLETEDSLKDVAHPDIIYAPILDIHRETLERYKEKEKDVSSVVSENCGANGTDTATNNENADTDKEKMGAEEEDTISARCETVLNTTLAEFDAYHTAKQEDFERIVKSHLDGEIAFYEKVLARLQMARGLYDTSPIELSLTMPGPRQPSIYERNLHNALNSSTPASNFSDAQPLKVPAPHVLDYRGRPSMRPVSDAIDVIQGLLGVGSGGGVGARSRERGRGSEVREGDEGSVSVFGKLW